MFSRQRDTRFARDLIKISLSDAGLSEFGHYPLFLAIRHSFDRSLDGHGRRPEALALAEEALWRATSEWLSGRTFPTGSARDTVAAAKREGFDLPERALEFLPLRRFLC
jgi:hypothetical protein